jgi:hypothetical protein
MLESRTVKCMLLLCEVQYPTINEAAFTNFLVSSELDILAKFVLKNFICNFKGICVNV